MKDYENSILSTKNLLTILENLRTAIYIVDGDGKLVFINDAALELEHFDKEVVMGKHLEDIYEYTVFQKGYDSPTLECVKTGVAIPEKNLEWYAQKGTVVNAFVSATPFTNEDGSWDGAFSTAENIDALRTRLNELGTFKKKTSFRLKTKQLKNGTSYVFNDIIGESDAMKSTVTIAKRFASKQAPVMIYGETGTGKELFAQSIHNASQCFSGPFVPINCAAIPETLLESMLFGTVKGAFTGAIDSPGLFEKAEGGSIFLDEINSMPIMLQAKLLRALQEKEVQRIGDNKIRKIDCRIISATNKLPEDAIRDNEMREDLFYRLSTGMLWIPSLKERNGDLPLLIDYFIDKANDDLHTNIEGVSPELEKLLMEYYWPGNVRELANTIESAVNMTYEDDRILDVQHLPTYLKKHFAQELTQLPNAAQIFTVREKDERKFKQFPTMDFDTDINTMVNQYEKSIIELALSGSRGNLSKCGEKLGISRQTLTAKIKRHHIDISKYKKES